MIPRPVLALLLGAMAAAADQPLLLPMPEMLRLLDAKREWLLLPLAEHERLVSAGRDPAPRATGTPAFLSTATVRLRVAGGDMIEAEAGFLAINRSDGPALAELFAEAPHGLGAIVLDGTPAVAASGAPVRILLPRPGLHRGTVRWSARLAGEALRREGRVPLPLAGGLDLHADGDGRGELIASGLERDGDGWRLAGPAPAILPLAWTPARGNGGDLVFGIDHALDVELQDGTAQVRWAMRIDPRRGPPPGRLAIALPDGFTCVRPLEGAQSVTTTAAGAEIVLAPGAETCALECLLAAGRPVALPRVIAAAWQSGVVRLSGPGVLACEPPTGWRPLGVQDSEGGRMFAVSAPDLGMNVSCLSADAGSSLITSATLAVGPADAILDQVITLRAGGTRLFAVDLTLPAGWRPTAMTADGCVAPDPADVPAGATIRLSIPAGLEPGRELSVLLRAEAATASLPAVGPVSVAQAMRASHRLILAAAPGIDLAVVASGWRQADLAPGLPAAARMELLGEGSVPPLGVHASPRQAAVEADAVCWLLPERDGTWVRCDLRLAVRDGEIDRLDLDLPLRRDADLRLEGDRLRLDGDGPFVVVSPAAWRGERLLRIEGRLRQEASGRLPAITMRVPGSDRAVALRRWIVLQSPSEHDLRLAPGPGARSADPDELPAFSAPIPGAEIAAAWRLGDGDAGGYALEPRSLAPMPPGFIDALVIATQVGRDGWRCRAEARLSAAGLDELDLGLPPGSRLESAAVDGAVATVRAVDGRTLLRLPGRTLVQLVLRYAGDGPADGLPPPRLGGLPVTRSEWTVAVDAGLLARVREGPGLMPMRPIATRNRRWMGGWTAPELSHDRVGPPSAPVLTAPADPRALATTFAPAAPVGDLAMHLDGSIMRGSQTGAPAALGLSTSPMQALLAWDAVGRALAVVAACAALLAPRLLVIIAAAAVPAALALVGWQTTCGPLLALLEWLPPVVLVLVVARLIHQRWRAP